MATYYELLKVQPTASVAEIEAACDSLYAAAHKLVTHHVPKIADAASRDVRNLETIRSTLLDLDKRAVYDAAIGVRGSIGGLADPDALLRMASSPPSPPAPAKEPTGAPASRNLWRCPRCDADNQPNTEHCLGCGAELVRKCPECAANTSLVVTGFCSKCGFKYEVAVERNKLKVRIDAIRADLPRLKAQRDQLQSEIGSIVFRRESLGISLGFILLTIFFVFYWCKILLKRIAIITLLELM